MSDASEWVWQGWMGPMADAVAGKALTDVDARAGARVPEPDVAPAFFDAVGTYGMFGVQTRRGSPIETPAGLIAAREDIVGRMLGA
jgi:hypothetical protein